MYRLILLFLLFSFIRPSMAAVSIIPSENLPAEFKFLYHSAKYESQNELKEINASLTLLDESLEELAPSDRLFFIKSEVYKTLLTAPPEEFQGQMPNDASLVKEFHENGLQTEDPFYQWLSSAIRKDLENFSQSPHFSSMLKKHSDEAPLNSKEEELLSRMKLILPWVRFLKISNNKEREELVHKVMPLITKKLSLITYQFLTYSRFESFNPQSQKEKFTHFDIKELEPEEEKKEQDKIQKIVDEVINNPELLPTPVPGWKPEDDMAQWRPSPQGESPDEDYEPPKELPKPVNDWVEDL